MKKRTSNVSRRVVSLLMSLVLTLTLVTPAAFATEVVGGSGTAIIEGNANPADANPNEDTEGKDDENKDTEHGGDEQPTNPGDEDKNPGEGEGDDANKPDEDKKDEAPDGENKDEENKDEQPTEDENNGDDEIALLNDENAADAWDGTAVDTSWYAGHENETKFSIGTAAELAGLAALVNGTAKDAEGKPIAAVNFYDETTKTDKTIKLTADIDLGDKEWTPIGNGNNSFAFSGTFDGDGYTISGLNVPDANAPGLFGCIFGTVQNLIVKGSVTVGDEADNGDYWEAGGVVCDNNGTVQNCGFYGSVNDEIGLDAGGVAGGGYGKVLNCWYYMTDESSSVSKVSVCTATNCVVISSSGAMTAAKLATLQTNAPETGKAWSWKEGDAYPTLIDPPKAITMQPVFPGCKAEVSANGTPLSATNGYTYEVTDDTVTIAVSGSSDAIYYAASESENAYTTEGENANLKKLESDTTFNKNTLPKTYYYGTLADFAALAAWNSVTKAYNVITAHNQLKALARMVNSGKDDMAGKTIYLQRDITLAGDWTPIGTAESPFKGTFTIMGNYSISNLPNDLFGVVEGGTVKSVTISGGTGRLVNTLKSGTVENCMSTAKVTGEGGGLVGTSAGTVKNSYYYNEGSKNTVAVSGGTVTNCYYLADVSTWGQTYDPGARTEEEFKAGRVTWELGSSWGANASDNLPCLGLNKKLYQLTLTKLGDAGMDGVTIENDNALTNGDTQYLYGTAETEVRLKEIISDGSTITYSPAKPEKIQDPKNNSTVNTYYYTIGEKVDADISWYKDADNEFTLTNAAELFGLAQLVNGGTNFANKTVKLGEDIDLTGYIWTPIGIGNYSFKGVFDGGNHKITSMNVRAADTHNVGLFGYVSGGTVKNLQVEGSVSYTGNTYVYGDVGGIVGCLGDSGAVTNCLSKVTVEGSGKIANVGGVVGNLIAGTINLCWNEGTVNGGSGSVGGIVGTNSGGTVTNCANFGTVTGSSTAGGISGSGAVANSYNLGNVTGAENTTYGISSAAATNSYYLCKLNGAEAAEMKYVDRETTKQDITTAEEDGKTVYAVDNDVLVNVLNKNKSRYIEWINKQDAPYNPVHITRWDGSYEPGVEGIATLVYDPNGGEGQRWGDTQMVTSGSASFTVETVDKLGFRHENGTFLGWSTDPRAKTADNRYAAGKTVSVEKDKTVTLYAVWENIWTGSGTEADAYQISNAADLTALQTQVNEKGFSYTGKWFILTSDINLNNANWTPIGIDAFHPFNGNLDGGNHAISGLKVNTSTQWAGLFGYVDSPAGNAVVMRDLTLKDGSVTTTFTGTSFCGGLVAYVWGGIILNDVTVEGFTVKGGIDGTGGLVGSGSVAMTNCHNRGGFVTGRYAGGLAGKGYSNLQDRVFAGCTNKAAVVGERTAGGMTGNETYSNGSYTSCTNSGSISATQGYASGIAAGGSYERCSNSGAVTGQQAAGICVNGSKATNCSNTGAVTGTGTGTGTGYAAGILTNGGYGGTVEFCWNTGSVEASTPVKAFGILYGWGAYNRVRNSFSYVPGANIGLAPTELKEENVSDSYYLADKKDSVSSVGEWASADDFASGKVAWGVDGGVNAHKNYWTQGGSGYPIPIGEGTSTSYYRAQVTCGTGGTATIKRGDGRTGDADNAVYGPSGTKVTVTATPKDSSFALKSLTLDLMSTGTTSDLANPGSFALGAANAKVVATFASAGSGGGSGSGSGSGSGAGTGDENDEGLQDGMNMDVEYNVKGLVLSAYTEWGSNGGGKTFSKWLKDSPNVLRALIANSLDNMAAAAAAKKTDEASALAQALLASLNEHSGVAGKDGDAISKALQRFMTSGTEATFSTWLTTGSGKASGTLESIFTQYTDSLLALADRLYTKWESSGTSMTFPAWLDAQQVSMENLSETAEEPDTDTTDESQTTEAPEDVPDGQESEGQVSGNSIWEIIGTAVRENPIIVWSIVAVVAALVIVGAVRRYHKVKRDERDDNGAE